MKSRGSDIIDVKGRPSLRLLQIFQAAVNAQSVSEASKTIGITQPAAAQSIHRLEAMLDAELLERGRLGCRPSELGVILHRRIGRLFDQIERALSEPLVGPPFAEDRRVSILARRITEGQVRALAAIDVAGSIERAAHTLGISPPAVQRALRSLEDLLRRSLCARTPRGTCTTRSGAELARRLRVAIRELDDAIDEIELARGCGAARVMIGILPMACIPIVADTLDLLAREFPGVSIHVTEGVYQVLAPQLRSGQIDLLFGVLRNDKSTPDLLKLPLLDDPHVVVARYDHPLAGRVAITVDDLARFEWVVPPATSPRRRQIEDLFAGTGLKAEIGVETNSLGTAKSLLRVSDRITVLARYDAEREVRLRELCILNVARQIARDPVGLTTRRDWQPTLVQRRFIEITSERCGLANLSATHQSTGRTAI